MLMVCLFGCVDLLIDATLRPGAIADGGAWPRNPGGGGGWGGVRLDHLESLCFLLFLAWCPHPQALAPLGSACCEGNNETLGLLVDTGWSSKHDLIRDNT